MTLTLKLPPDVEERLVAEAQQRGLATEDYALELLQRQLSPEEKRLKMMSLLQAWREEPEDEGEQEAWESFVRGLDENRSSARKLFPPEMKGVSW